jgi:hypothetical protein
MSKKQFEPCSLQEATHVEINKVVYQIVGNICTYNIGLRWLEQDVRIPIDLFHILGIKPLREIKSKPIEFEHIFTFEETSLGIIPCEAEGKKFKCVEILEEEK